MKIENIEYTNYRGLKSGSLSFEKDLTIIIGKNGTGKTSVLSAVSIILSWIIARLKSDKGNGLYIDTESITNHHLHSKIDFKLEGIEQPITIPNKAKSGIPKKYSLNIDPLKSYILRKREDFEACNFKTNIPTFVYYGVKRAVVDIPLRIRDKEYSLLDTYKDCLNGAANFRDFFTWFRNQEDIENEYKVNISANHNTRELDVFRRALSIFMPDYSNIKVRRSPLRMEVEKHGKTIYVNQLSDGEKIYLALIGDLCHRMVLANPVLNDPLMGEGIVLIDEIDLHLHPEWQGDFAAKLNKVFPNIQFIISTHSPHVINNVNPEKIRMLNDEGVESPEYSYGMPLKIVLEDIMGLKSEVPDKVKDLFEDVHKLLNNVEIEKAENLLEELYVLVPHHPELVRIAKIIERNKRKM